MLNKHKVINQLKGVIPQAFVSLDHEIAYALACWQWLVAHPEILQEILSCNTTSLPVLCEPLTKSHNTITSKDLYRVLAVDGSQVYPDRHQGISCFLLNIGRAQLTYTYPHASALLDSEPFIFTQEHTEGINLTAELVDCQRSELELKKGFEYSLAAFKNNPELPLLCLSDGSLIFWYLDTKEPAIKQKFLSSSCALLDLFYHHKLLIAGFISLPKSKDIISVIRAGLSQKLIPLMPAEPIMFDYVCDADIMQHVVPSYCPSELWEHQSALVDYYPAHSKPYFLYINTGDEIARVEVPAWIAQDSDKLNLVLSIIIDQCKKGRGYPVSLAEAHEQAVVKSADREFFYIMLSKLTADNKYNYNYSQKSIKKRLVGI